MCFAAPFDAQQSLPCLPPLLRWHRCFHPGWQFVICVDDSAHSLLYSIYVPHITEVSSLLLCDVCPFFWVMRERELVGEPEQEKKFAIAIAPKYRRVRLSHNDKWCLLRYPCL